MKTKKEIKRIGKEESINRQRMLTKKKNTLQNKIRKEGRNNSNDSHK